MDGSVAVELNVYTYTGTRQASCCAMPQAFV